MSRTKRKAKRRIKRHYIPDPDSPVRLSLTLRHYQVEGLGGRDKAREFLYGAVNAVSVVQDN